MSDYVHRTYQIEAESWSAFHGSHRSLCHNCNWRGPWQVDPFAARRDGEAHVLDAFNMETT